MEIKGGKMKRTEALDEIFESLGTLFRKEYPMDFKMQIWDEVKELSVEDIQKIGKNLLTYQAPPVFQDFVFEKKRIMEENRIKATVEVVCGECGEKFKTEKDSKFDLLEMCPKCYKWAKSEEGRRIMRQRFEDLRKKSKNS